MRSSLPHLIEAGADRRLVIDDRPTILLGGQVHNSTSSSARHFEAAAKKLRSLNLSTALTPVTWELLEPEEGRFDFTGVDDLLRIAGEHDLRLVLLWFGAFKERGLDLRRVAPPIGPGSHARAPVTRSCV